MQVKYVANDGKEFTDENECIKYERSITNLSELFPDLKCDNSIIPPAILLTGYTNINGKEIKLDDLIIESFRIYSYEDINRICKALKKLGYIALCEAIYAKYDSRYSAEILSLISIINNDGIRSYKKFAFINAQYRILDTYKDSIYYDYPCIAPKWIKITYRYTL